MKKLAIFPSPSGSNYSCVISGLIAEKTRAALRSINVNGEIFAQYNDNLQVTYACSRGHVMAVRLQENTGGIPRGAQILVNKFAFNRAINFADNIFNNWGGSCGVPMLAQQVQRWGRHPKMNGLQTVTIEYANFNNDLDAKLFHDNSEVLSSQIANVIKFAYYDTFIKG